MIEVELELTDEEMALVDARAAARGITREEMIREIVVTVLEARKREPEEPQGGEG
jgi:hypothetical protein